MKLKTIFILFLSITCISVAQLPKLKPDVEYDGYKGPVKTLTESIYEANGTSDNPMTLSKLESSQIRYEKSGKKVDIKYYTNENQIIFRIRHKRDGIGNIILDQSIDPQDNVIGRTYYSFNPQNQLIEILTYDQEMQLENRVHIKYDKKGSIIERSYNDKHNEIRKKEVYHYNENGTIAKTTIYDRKNTKVQEVLYEYDNHHEITTQTTFDYYNDKAEITAQMYTYEYDDYGNWIKKIEYTVNKGNLEPNLIIERDYEYYQK